MDWIESRSDVVLTDISATVSFMPAPSICLNGQESGPTSLKNGQTLRFFFFFFQILLLQKAVDRTVKTIRRGYNGC